MARPLFFQESYFFRTSPVDENVNYDLIRPVVWDCQELYIQDILGTPLYKVIKDEIVTNLGTLTTPRLVSLVRDYVAPCLLNYVLAESQVNMLYQFRNKSVTTGRTDYDDSVDYNQHLYLKDQFKIKAEKYAKKIEDYLCINTATYPEYITYTTSDQVRAQAQKSTVSVWLGGSYATKGYGQDYYEQR